jgi:uncharacterized membrane protein YgdD (TMEM256/DUF423 family)
MYCLFMEFKDPTLRLRLKKTGTKPWPNNSASQYDRSMNPNKIGLFRSGLLLTGIAIGIQAFGAHGLKRMLDTAQLETFETASRYLIWGGMWTMILGLAHPYFRLPRLAIRLILAGIILFSGSLLLYLCFSDKYWVFVTPIGGVLMVIGFILAGSMSREKEESKPRQDTP